MRTARVAAMLGGIAILVFSLAVVRVSQAAPPAQSYEPVEDLRPLSGLPLSKGSRMASAIEQLVEAAESLPASAQVTANALSRARPAVGALLESGLLRLDQRGRVQVYLRLARSGQDVLQELRSLGVAVEQQDDTGTLLQAWANPRALRRVAGLDSVKAITLPRYGRVNVGSALTEGDALLGLDELRARLGVDGAGVTVGVISDGIAGLEDAIAAGDLPPTTLNRDATGKLISTTGGVTAVSFSANQDLEEGFGGPGAEGTAMLEIVHDIAPGARLRFANFDTDLEFMMAVRYLATISDVVVDDISFFGGPYDQSSDVSTNTAGVLSSLSSPIRGYFTSVGNHALHHYEEGFVPAAACILAPPNLCHQFSATSSTTNALSLAPGPANPVFVPSGGMVVVFLTWDDVFGATTSDYDLFLFQHDPFELAELSISDNTQTGEPAEALAFVNLGPDQFFDIFIVNFNGASPAHNLEMFVFGGASLPNDTEINYNTTRSSVPMQSDSGGGVVSVGTINASDPGTDTIAPYSSQGPANNGAIKPDVTAIDGVAVTGSGGFGTPFFGTSAAAPHLAGLAALLLELEPTLLSGEPGDDPLADRAALRAAILGSARDLGSPGMDNTYGSGLANGPGAASLVKPAPVVDAGPVQSVVLGSPVNILASFTDTDALETHTATIDWGDGTPPEAGAVSEADGSGTVSGSHTYAAIGTYTVLVTVTDSLGNSGSDTVVVTVGSPVVKCRGVPATIVGTDGDDVLTGTDSVDVIAGLAGNDTINALAGNDLVCGGDGDDTINSGDGADRVYSGNGNDTVDGGNQSDRLYGGAGDDNLLGSGGNDKLRCGAGVDTADGGPGRNDMAAANCETVTGVP